ncbi:hypothetical protein Dimus_022482, partial [Dionaea muscipula]
MRNTTPSISLPRTKTQPAFPIRYTNDGRARTVVNHRLASTTNVTQRWALCEGDAQRGVAAKAFGERDNNHDQQQFHPRRGGFRAVNTSKQALLS